MDKIKELKAELFDLQLQSNAVQNKYQQKYKELSELVNAELKEQGEEEPKDDE